jgi:hypothetical protein
MRRGRYATAGCACALLALLSPQGGLAHEPSGTRSGYVSSVTEIRPSILGLQASILGTQERLLVRNWSGKVVIIFGHSRRPLFRLDERGIFQFDGVRWRNLRAGTSFSWHDHRIGWFQSALPEVVRRAPDESHYIRAWTVPGTADGQPFVIRGLLGYAPPPAAAKSRKWMLPTAVGLAALLIVAGVGARQLWRRAP